MANNMFMDTANMDVLSLSIQKKIGQIRDVQNEIKDKLSQIDGTSSIWKGKGANSFVNLSNKVVSDFDPTITELENYNLFLISVIENYENIEKKLNDDVDKNGENLEIE